MSGKNAFMHKLKTTLTSFIHLLKDKLIKPVFAHCDTEDGPVIKAAKAAILSGNVNAVLIWVRAVDEDKINEAFQNTLKKISKAGNEAESETAQAEFYKLLVQHHREGEGEKYDGIKPQGSTSHAIILADKAIDTGNFDEVLRHIKSETHKNQASADFKELMVKKYFDVDDLAAGREYVKSYAAFVHLIEHLLSHSSESSHHHKGC